MSLSCFLCNRYVFILDGQAELLNQVYLYPDDLASLEGALGYCHTKCLLHSRWGLLWHSYKLRYFSNPRFKFTNYDQIGFAVFCDIVNGDVHILQNNGQSWSFRGRSISKRLEISDSNIYLKIHDTNYNFHIGISNILILEIQNSLSTIGFYPIPDLVRKLNIESCILHPDSLSNGKYQFSKEELKNGWTPNSVSGDMIYRRYIPTVVYDLWLAHRLLK